MSRSDQSKGENERCSISHTFFHFIIFLCKDIDLKLQAKLQRSKKPKKKRCQKNPSIIFKARLLKQAKKYIHVITFSMPSLDIQQMFSFPKKSLRKLVCLHPHRSLLSSSLIFFSIFFLLYCIRHQKHGSSIFILRNVICKYL